MVRDDLKSALTSAMKAREAIAVSTLRLILAALKDRDIAGRAKGQADGIDDDEIMRMLQTMVRQRRESIALYEQGGRLELAQREADEIGIIERFLPKQLTGDELAAVVSGVIFDIGAATLKDMGRVMAALKDRYAGRIDLSKASAIVKERLGQ